MEEQDELKFPAFPFLPYSIQIDFMKALYRSLDRGGISMLESPTGTGKTLSIICSAMQWLIDQREKRKAEPISQSKKSENQCGSDDEPDWLRDFVPNKDDKLVEKKKVKDIKKKKKTLGIGIGSVGVDDITEQEAYGEKKNQKNVREKIGGGEIDDDKFLLEEYESEEEVGTGNGLSKRKAGGFSAASSSDEEENDGFDDEEEEEAPMKIYFCSRTHSQLSQFVKELKKTIFATQLKVVCLGSRKNFCINEDVLKLGSSNRINERCLELQKNKKEGGSKMKTIAAGGRIRRTKASCGCPMLRKYKLQKQFRDEVYDEGALDIEDLLRLGSKIGTCPYYGSRIMVPAADLVILPYQSVLSKSSRESLGLNIKRSVIIIDEAHNLADSLVSMYDTRLSLSQLEQLHAQLGKYFERFRNLLGPSNRRYIQTLLVITRAFLQILRSENNSTQGDYTSDAAEGVSGRKVPNDCSMAINEFLFSLNIDNINFVKLLRYIKESNIMHKVSGYGDKAALLRNSSYTTNGDGSYDEGSSLSGFRALADMLQSLTNNDGDGRIIISRRPTCSGQEGGYLKYVMLTGEKIFSEIMDQAHAVVLAGGTLQPIEETRERLFPRLTLDQLQFFSCSHIVPPESILPIAVSRGPTGKPFDFSYSSRSSPIMIQELGLLLCNLATVVPEGIVVFFSSFDYEGLVYNAWNDSGILTRISKKKRVFREPRKTTDVEHILKEYKNTIDASSRGDPKSDPPPQTGALLLAVVGGKISEGINFSDGMGRCIVMVGLPYPSPSDIELVERVKHIECLGDNGSNKTPEFKDSYSGDVKSGFDILRSCKRRGKEYYENLCMKAVNQSIGRAIRHINDYAAILLVDGRYACDSSQRSFSHPTNKLPQWIKDRLIPKTNNYGEIHKHLHQFFKLNSKKTEVRQTNLG